LQRIVRRCLAKEPDKRYQSIREVAIELEELHKELKGAAELEYSSQPASGAATGKFGVRSTIHSTSSAEYLFSEIKRHKGGAFLVLGVTGVLVAGLAFGLYKWVGQRPRGGPSQPLKISRLTASGKALEAAISPDGKWVVYVQKDGSEQSLWIRQIATNSIIQIVPPAEVRIGRETFSPDSNYVYYFIIERNSPAGVLYQAPTIGGPPKKLTDFKENGVWRYSWSRDGKQLALTRGTVKSDVVLIKDFR
jgi:eukaryotic-like serine/threonine-protein kinase